MIADSLMDNALFFFRDRIEQAVNSRNYAGGGDRLRIGKNDTIYERLDQQFTFAQAMQQSVIMKGADVTHNSVKQMLKNGRNRVLSRKWRPEAIIKRENGRKHLSEQTASGRCVRYQIDINQDGFMEMLKIYRKV